MRARNWIGGAVAALALGGVAMNDVALAQTASTTLAPRTIRGGTERIVNGAPVFDISEHAWQVGFIIAYEDGGKDLCGGTAIAPRWVVTAAHCFLDGVDVQGSEARFGSNKIMDGAQVARIEKVIVHPDFTLEGLRNDIALVKLRADLTDRMVPLIGRDESVDLGTVLEVTGWGATAEGAPSSNILLKAGVPLVSNDECNKPESYDGQITSRMLCAGHKEGGTDACQGDSGGPLVWRSPDGPKLVGVVSWGIGCAQALRYGVYTRVKVYRNWINQTVLGDD